MEQLLWFMKGWDTVADKEAFDNLVVDAFEIQTKEMSGQFVEINLLLAADGGGKSGFDAIAPDLS